MIHRPSIVFLNRVYPPMRGASGRILHDLAKIFAKEGWHVTVITTGPKAGMERDGSIRVIRVKGPDKPRGVLGYGWIWTKMFWKALRLPRRHLLVTMTDPPLLVVAGRIVAGLKKSRHIHWCQDIYPDILPALGKSLPGPVQKLCAGLARRSLKAADKIIVVGRCMAERLSAAGVDTRQISVVPNWPDFALFYPPANDAKVNLKTVKEARPYKDMVKTGLKFRVLYAGTAGLAHPVETILEAAGLLQYECPDIEFVFVGGGARFEEMAHLRDARGLDNVRFLPWQPASALRKLMESGDVHLVAMKEEAAGCLVPSKLYSAFAVGRPCIFIGPAQCEAARVLHDFKAGKTVPENDAKKLARAIRKYRENGEAWSAAQKGAAEAGGVFVPKESITAWMERAAAVVQSELTG